MEGLRNRIITHGEVLPGGIVKVDSFLNHQLDTALLDEAGREFYEYFKGRGVTKILTVESSGIAIACMAARYFSVPVLFAKKSEAKNLSSGIYSSDVFSFTRGKIFTIRVDKRYITSDDKILIIDDFLANGRAMVGLIDIARQAGATIIGAGICIEKAFQEGGKLIRDMGIDLCSLAIIDVDANGKLIFSGAPTKNKAGEAT